MFELHNLAVDELECDELRANRITCDILNGVTKEELSCLHGVKSNIQKQIDDLTDEFNTLIAAWS